MSEGYHPELNSSPLLYDTEHRQYQMLIGMLKCIVCLGRIDISFAVASLSRFSACPRKGHLERVLKVFAYLNKHDNQRIVVDSRDLILVGGKDALDMDFTKEFAELYPEAVEEIDAKASMALIDELEITAFVDSCT